MLHTHRRTDAAVTMAVLRWRVPGRRLGILHVDESGRLVSLREKPQTETSSSPAGRTAKRNWRAWPGRRGPRVPATWASTCSTREAFLRPAARPPTAVDIVRDLFVSCLGNARVRLNFFDDYWDDFWAAIRLVTTRLTSPWRRRPAVRLPQSPRASSNAHALPAGVAPPGRAGCQRCLISDGLQVGAGACSNGCGRRHPQSTSARRPAARDRLPSAPDASRPTPTARQPRPRRPDLGVGAGSVVRRAVLDKDCRVGRNVSITNDRARSHADADNYSSATASS